MNGSTHLTGAEPQRSTVKPCLHERHVGSCSHCQRAQLARWNTQLLDSVPSLGTLLPVEPGIVASP